MNRSPFGPQGAVESHPERGRQRLGGEPGRDGVDQLGAFDPLEQQVDARRRRPATTPSPGARPSWPSAGRGVQPW